MTSDMDDRGSSALFKPLKIGRNTLTHRLVLAPLTRYRAYDNHVPMPIVETYYSQRGSTPGTLLISEATLLNPQAGGYANVPGIYNQEQINGWKKVTAAVHAKGSFIYCQLWALGRASSPKFFEKEFPDLQVVSSSATPLPGVSEPRALSEEEIWDFVEAYKRAAVNAIEAGFDGVELHGANGYLIDQFTQDTCNTRTDQWGGSIEKRAKFAIEATKAVVNAIGKDRTAIRLSPWSPFQAMRMKDPIPQFSFLVEELAKLDLAYLHLVQSRVAGNADVDGDENLDFAVKLWGDRPLLLAGGYRSEDAYKAADEEYAGKDVCIVFGRYYISNPDLPYRVRHQIPFEKYDRERFYKPKSPDGYIDYPFADGFTESKL